MKKYLKITMIVMLSVVVIYVLFITEEVIRLSHNSLAEPLIVFEEEYTGDDGDVTYKSLGFTLTTEIAKFSENKDMVYPISQELWLFDKFLIWGWIS